MKIELETKLNINDIVYLVSLDYITEVIVKKITIIIPSEIRYGYFYVDSYMEGEEDTSGIPFFIDSDINDMSNNPYLSGKSTVMTNFDEALALIVERLRRRFKK